MHVSRQGPSPRRLYRPLACFSVDTHKTQGSFTFPRRKVGSEQKRSAWTTHLILSRALHFAATISSSGVVFFFILVAGPAIGPATPYAQLEVNRFHGRLSLIFWLSIVLALLSGAIWFCLVAADIGDRPPSQIFTDDLAWSVLTDTGFGRVWAARLLIGALLAATAWLRGLDNKQHWRRIIQLALAAAFLASLAWAGHGAATPGATGDIHLTADTLHLIAVGAWVGGLLPFALFLKAMRTQALCGWEPSAIAAVRHFSTIGMIAVGTILATGAVNTWNLVGSADALLSTAYGQLLLLKLLLFAAMVCIAADNRWRLSPRLGSGEHNRKARTQQPHRGWAGPLHSHRRRRLGDYCPRAR